MGVEQFFNVDPESVVKLAELGSYEYIIIGSGFGGGILADELAGQQKRVLVLEKGEAQWSTHLDNNPRPDFARGRHDSPEGNETIYHAAKGLIQVVEDSDPYAGGPLYTLGGRSLVWGLNIPQVDPTTLNEHFPPAIAQDLTSTYYQKAFDRLTNNSQHDATYPTGHIRQEDIDSTAAELNTALQDYLAPNESVVLMPVACEFVPKDAYRFPMGAYSTAPALLNRIYGKDKNFTALLHSEVIDMDIDKEKGAVTSIRIRHGVNQTVYRIPAGKAKVILSAGTINTARIALNSGLQAINPLVGRGLIDHAMYDVRFARRTTSKRQPMNFKALLHINGTTALTNVTVNNDFFFAGSSNVPIQQYLDMDGHEIEHRIAHRDYNEAEYDTIAILLEYGANLKDDNEVLTHACADPVIRVRRNEIYADEESQIVMQTMATKIRNMVISKFLHHKKNERGIPIIIPPSEIKISPRMVIREFGLVAHEVGTLRMDNPKCPTGVVDTNLKVHGLSNLYTCDLSVMPFSTPSNPTLTLSALSIRLAAHLMSLEGQTASGNPKFVQQ